MANTEHRPRAFGVEEEYQLLDAQTGAPTDQAAEVILATPELGEQTEREYFSSQLETATPICRTGDEAEVVLAGFRSVVSKAAAERGVVLAGTGLPPLGGDTAGTVTPKPRYRRIEAEMRGVAEHQHATGTHVHVEVPSSDAGVDALARIARWCPAMMALTANSPLWCGAPTGFASWRHIMARLWPVAGYPDGFRDGQHYDRAVANLIETGVIPDAGMVSWVVRLSGNYPTIEVRVADAQLDPGDAVAFAAIVRALVDQALHQAQHGEPRPDYTPNLVNGANWMAARNGLGSELIDPLAQEALPAFALIERMLETIGDELDRFGDRDRVDRYLQRLREEGGPADQQLAAFESGGVQSLLELYRHA